MLLTVRCLKNIFQIEIEDRSTVEALKDYIAKICDIQHFELVFRGMILSNRRQQINMILHNGGVVYVKQQTQLTSTKKHQLRYVIQELIQQMNGRNSQQIQDIVNSLEHYQRVRILNLFNGMKLEDLEKLRPLIDQLQQSIGLQVI